MPCLSSNAIILLRLASTTLAVIPASYPRIYVYLQVSQLSDYQDHSTALKYWLVHCSQQFVAYLDEAIFSTGCHYQTIFVGSVTRKQDEPESYRIHLLPSQIGQYTWLSESCSTSLQLHQNVLHASLDKCRDTIQKYNLCRKITYDYYHYIGSFL